MCMKEIFKGRVKISFKCNLYSPIFKRRIQENYVIKEVERIR